MQDWIVKYWVEWLFGQIVGAQGVAYKRLSNRIKKEKTSQLAIMNGMRSLLKYSIKNEYQRCSDQGFCSIADRENLEDMYDAYKQLGGNGTITGLMEKLRKMPTKEKGDRK